MPSSRPASSEPSSGPPTLSPGRRRTFQAIIFVVLFGIAELSTRLWFGYQPDYEQLRLHLAGVPRASVMMCIGQPYVNYAPIPGLMQGGEPGHNEQGYRGKAVALKKSPGIARLLCMGASTTYSTGVERACESYPAQLERILNESPPAGWDGVEVINGGLPYGSTAELMNHYHFKFHFFAPDLVILNTGGADADATGRPHYQPDYTHWRRQPCVPDPMPVLTRWTMHSRVVALATILFVHGRPPSRFETLLPGQDTLPAARWFPEEPLEELVNLPDDVYAFRHNLERMIDEIQDDGSKVLLVPFRPAPGEGYPEIIRNGFKRNEQEVRELAKELGLPLAPFPVETISKGNWTDRAHVNTEGTREKAAHIAPFARRALAR